MTDAQGPEYALNAIQPISDDFSTDGYLNEYARVDHQHPLSPSLRAAIFGTGGGSPYVQKTGDTMSGTLTMSGANNINLGTGWISFSNTGNRIVYHTNLGSNPWMTGPRIIGENGFAFYNAVQGQDVLGYRGVSGTYYMWITNKLLIGSGPNDAASVYPLEVAGGARLNVGHLYLTSGYAVNWATLGTSLYSQDGSWVRASPNFYCAGVVGGNGGISAGGAGGSMGGYTGIYCPGSAMFTAGIYTGTSGGYQTDRQCSLAWYGPTAFFNSPGAGRAGISLHPGGVAGHMRMDQSFASYMFVDTGGTAYYSCSASAFAVGSKRSYKQDIKDWPPKPGPGLSADEQPVKAMDLVRELNIVSYRRREEQLMAQTYKTDRRNAAWARLNDFKRTRGLELYPLEIHTCDDPICEGTLENPCAWRKNWQQEQLGLIVEDTVGIAPEIISYDQEGEPGFIDVHSHVSLLHAAIKELEERIYFLERVN